MTTLDFQYLRENVETVFYRLFDRMPIQDYSIALCYAAFGLIAGKLAYVLVSGILEALRFNRLCERIGVYEIVEARARDLPSRLVGRLAYWGILAFCLVGAIDSLNFVDVPLMFEAFVGITGRIICFAIIVVLADIVGGVIASVFDAVLLIVDHSFAGKTATPIRYGIVGGTALLGLELLGIDPETGAGQSVLAGAGLFALVVGVILALRRHAAFSIARKLAERFRVGDRIEIQDGKTGVVRRIECDHIIAATESDEFLIPASWLVESPVKREPI